MFEKLRKPGRAKSLITYLIFGAICLVFVFFGMFNTNLGGVSGGSGAAIVNSKVISIADFKEAYDRLSQRYSKNFNSLPAAQRQKQYEQLRQRAINDLINFEILSQSAAESGVYIADEEVRKTIIDIPAFQENGIFQRERYDNYIAYTRASPAEFEDKIRKELSSGKMRDLFTNSLKSLKSEDEKNTVLQDTKLNLEFVKFNKRTVGDKMVVSDPEAKEFLANEGNKKKVSENYTANKSQYTSKEEVSARHILIKVDAKKAGDEQAALEKIKNIEKQVTPENFGEMAAKYSEGPTKVKQGDLGSFSRGRMVKEFEEVAFSLPPGKVSGPVKTSFGYHLIKVEGKKPANTKALEEVEVAIAKKMIAEEKQDKAFAQVETSLKDPSAIKKFVSDNKLKWEETGEFSLKRTPPKLGVEADKILDAVLKAGLNKGEMLPEVQKDSGTYYIVKLKEMKLPGATTEKKLPDQFNSFFSAGRAYDVFGKWQEEQRKASKIQMNNRILVN